MDWWLVYSLPPLTQVGAILVGDLYSAAACWHSERTLPFRHSSWRLPSFRHGGPTFGVECNSHSVPTYMYAARYGSNPVLTRPGRRQVLISVECTHNRGHIATCAHRIVHNSTSQITSSVSKLFHLLSKVWMEMIVIRGMIRGAIGVPVQPTIFGSASF